jgi:hypothetical protein
MPLPAARVAASSFLGEKRTMSRTPFSQLTDSQILEADSLTAYAPNGDYLGQFIVSADGAVKSIEVEINRWELGMLARRVKALRGALNPEVEKYSK